MDQSNMTESKNIDIYVKYEILKKSEIDEASEPKLKGTEGEIRNEFLSYRCPNCARLVFYSYFCAFCWICKRS